MDRAAGEWPAASDSNAPPGVDSDGNAPPGGDSEAYWGVPPLPPTPPVPVDVYPAAGEWPAASDINSPSGGDSEAYWGAPPLPPTTPVPVDMPVDMDVDVDVDPAPPGGDSVDSAAAALFLVEPFWRRDLSGKLFPVDPFKPEYLDKLAGYYVEAARRLPLAEIPYLANCLIYRALTIGFADPVTNILLTAIDAYAHTDPYRMMMPADIEEARNKTSFANTARNSWIALTKFMCCYFRGLADPQAHLLLHMAGFDLRVAIQTVELHLAGGGPDYHRPELLVPDSARTKTAFQDAGYFVESPQLVRLMTSSYPCSMVEPVLEDLRRGEKLTAACVYKLYQMLRNPWSPPPSSSPTPPTPGTSRDSAGGLTHVICFGDGSFVTTHVSKDGVATATFSTSGPTDAAGFSEEATNLVSMFPIGPGRGLVSPEIFKSPDFLPFLRLQLLDMVHGVYLKAIAMLPVCALRHGHLLHSLLTAGHCYGPLDPVANVVINTIWYDALFPLSKDVTSKLAAADILDARSMHRIESRSIDGLVAYLCSRSPSTDEQAAVTLLCGSRLGLTFSDLSNMCDVTQAAKHPQPATFGDFLERESIRDLYQMYCHGRVHTNPDSAFELVKMTLVRSTRVAPVQRRCAQEDMDTSAKVDDSPQEFDRRVGLIPYESVGRSMDNTPALKILSTRRPSLMFKQDYIRGVLEHLLIGYGYNDPLAPLYKLGIICGVTSQKRYKYTHVFHANFLASSDGGSWWKLFFAEFWDQPLNRIEQSEKSFCCPIPDDHKYPGRCVICENRSSLIIHPQSLKYDMGNSLFPFPLLVNLVADTEKLDVDDI